MKTDLNSFFFEGLVSGTALAKENWKRRKQYLIQSVPLAQLSEYENAGWTTLKKNRRTARVKRPKPTDLAFEDRLWCMLARMGFKYMNSGRFFRLPYSEDCSLTQQVDAIAIDDETILIVECKAAENLTNRNFKETIEALGGKKLGIIETLKKIFPDSKHKIKFLFATSNYLLAKPDFERLANFDIVPFEDEQIEYYEELSQHLGPGAKYQLLGNLFQGQKIPELDSRVPAIRGRLGPHTYYFFSIEPYRLLKMAYVLHRTKANKDLMPTYQRIIKKERLKAIETFLAEGGFFPNSVTISIDTDRPLQFDPADTQCEDSVCRVGVLTLPQMYRSAFIIDGQHRVYGYACCKYKETNAIPVVAFENLARSKQVELFMQINENQKAVAKNLRNTLNADLLWSSKDLTESVKAIKLRIAQELGENKSSPLCERIIIGENKRTPKKCITIDTIYSALDRGNFFGTVTRNSIKGIGTFFDGNPDSTFERLNKFLMLCFSYVREHLEEQWELGEEKDGFITINSTIYALILIFSDICDHLANNEHVNPRLRTVDSLVSDAVVFVDPVIKHLRELPAESRTSVRRSYGSGGRTKLWRTLQIAIHEARCEFNPEGLDQYIVDSSKRYNTHSFEMIREIETYLKEDIRDKLKLGYGPSWWKKGVPLDVYEEAEQLASKKNREIDDPAKEVDPWNQLHLIDYRKIVLHNWGKLFQQKYSFPGIKGDKQEKTAWFARLNTIRNQNFHEYSVTEDEYNFLKTVYEWISTPQVT